MSLDDLTTDSVFRNNMVLQRETEFQISGKCSINTGISVKFAGIEKTANPDSEGKWSAVFPPLPPGGPYELSVSCENNSLKHKNILVGDVWFCSGQSNMTIPMDRVKYRYPEEIKNCSNDNIRILTVPEKYDFKHPFEEMPEADWESAGPDTIYNFSAIAWFFADYIFRKTKIPVGIINTSIGGTAVQSFMSEESLKDFPQCCAELDLLKDDSYVRNIMASDQKRLEEWNRELDSKDKGLSGNWHKNSSEFLSGKEMSIPGLLGTDPGKSANGSFWLMKETDVPESLAGKPGLLWLGRIVDSDHVWLNGTLVGSTTYQYPPRIYPVPADLIKPGRNTITARIVSNAGQGMFVPGKPYFLQIGNDKINLEGKWMFLRGAEMPPLDESVRFVTKPAGLFNAMISPFFKLKVKGILWYQGETNSDDSKDYREMIFSLINDWRSRWNNNSLPFISVQLPNYGKAESVPSESGWAEIREAQRRTLELDNTGLVAALDLGEWNDLHPLNKKDVGYRLAVEAQKLAYHDNSLPGCPAAESAGKENGKVKILISSCGSGLVTNNRLKPSHFALAGKDRKFQWAQAEISDNTIIVSSPDIPDPEYVRYAWADNPESANVYNKEGFPLGTFEFCLRDSK